MISVFLEWEVEEAKEKGGPNLGTRGSPGEVGALW